MEITSSCIELYLYLENKMPFYKTSNSGWKVSRANVMVDF